MVFFEDELKKIFGGSEMFRNARYTGRACVARLNDAVNVKIEFAALENSSNFGALKAILINRTKGKIDESRFLFSDILGQKPLQSGKLISPHIWERLDKVEWYGYKPTADDYAAIADAVGGYIEMFREPQQEQERFGKHSYLTDAIKAAEKDLQQPLTSHGKKNNEPSR